jgi:hypothetical protein
MAIGERFSHVYKVPAGGSSPGKLVHVAGTSSSDDGAPCGTAVHISGQVLLYPGSVAVAAAPSLPGAFYWTTRSSIWSVGLVPGRAQPSSPVQFVLSTRWRSAPRLRLDSLDRNTIRHSHTPVPAHGVVWRSIQQDARTALIVHCRDCLQRRLRHLLCSHRRHPTPLRQPHRLPVGGLL